MCKENLHEHSHNHKHDHDGKEHEHEDCHSHEHAHDGDHTHSHEHNHDGKSESLMSDNLSKEEKTLKLLLSHWVEHNKAHEEGFKEWVEKSKQMGRTEASHSIRKAIEFMEEADAMLLEAQKHI